jgi:hypothetical protein
MVDIFLLHGVLVRGTHYVEWNLRNLKEALLTVHIMKGLGGFHGLRSSVKKSKGKIS